MRKFDVEKEKCVVFVDEAMKTYQSEIDGLSKNGLMCNFIISMTETKVDNGSFKKMSSEEIVKLQIMYSVSRLFTKAKSSCKYLDKMIKELESRNVFLYKTRFNIW